MDVKIIERVCKEAKIPYEIQFYPWERCVQMIKQGKADVIFGILKNEERKAYLKYPDQPVSFDKRVIVSKKSSKLNIKSIQDLQGLTVGIVRGYAYHPDFDKSTIYTKDISTSTNQSLEKLKADRFSLVATNEYVARFYIGSKEWKEYKVHPYIITEDPLYTAYAINSSNAMGWFDLYNKTAIDLQKKGELDKIRNKYK